MHANVLNYFLFAITYCIWDVGVELPSSTKTIINIGTKAGGIDYVISNGGHYRGEKIHFANGTMHH